MDVLYVLGTGTTWQDNELRYSLRSLEKFITGIGRVFIAGRIPPWITNVTHIEHPDVHACKERNIMEKISKACMHPDLSGQFLHVHDDHFALAPAHADNIPNWASNQLAALANSIRPGNNYKQAVLNTVQALTERGHPQWNFDIHTPIIYDREKFPKIMAMYDWIKPRGFVVKSLYANTLHLDPVYLTDVKINQPNALVETVRILKGRPWWSTGPRGLDVKLKELFAELYPTKSKFEL